MTHILPVILAGGQGGRLWPWSREDMPKAFLSYPTEQSPSMLQTTVDRFHDLPGVIVGNQRHVRQLSHPGWRVLLETEGRNTAPAIRMAAAAYPESLLAVMPVDHHIHPSDILRQRILQGASMAQSGHIVMFGVPPRYPSTQYGYVHPRHGFAEKPDQPENYIARGYQWNSGIYLLSAQRALDLTQHDPVVAIDYLVETLSTRDMILLSLDTEWHDVGTWYGMAQHLNPPWQYRPWGRHRVVKCGKLTRSYWKVKELQVTPDQRLSLQYHRYRKEHWSVIEGRGILHLSGRDRSLRAGDTAVIERGQPHRVQALGDQRLTIMEVQIGAEVDEDDIVRLQDDYGR